MGNGKLRGKLDGVSHADLYAIYAKLGSVHAVGKVFGLTGDTIHQYFIRNGIRLNYSKWKPEEDDTIRRYYTTTPPKEFNRITLARMLGRTKGAVATRALCLGLTDRRRPKRARPTTTQCELPWRRWVKFEHPRGFRGHTHTDQSKSIISRRSLVSWEKSKREGTGNMSPDNRLKASQRSSVRMLLRLKNNPQNVYSRCKAGRRGDLGNQYFRSSWEANYARYLNLLQSQGKIVRWEYEADTFWFKEIKRGVRSYLPDFKIWQTDGTIRYDEVKGWMDAKSATKLKRMKIYYPLVRVDVIGAARYKALSSTAAGIIKGWEK